MEAKPFHNPPLTPAAAPKPRINDPAISAISKPYSIAVAALLSRHSLAKHLIDYIPRSNYPISTTHNDTFVNEVLPRGVSVEKNPTLIVVAAALVDVDGRVLLQERASHRSMPGLWEFPGGKVEIDEAAEDALVRELHEELGIETDHACLAPAAFATHQSDEHYLLLLLYICRKWRGVPQPLDAAALQWVRPNQMFDLPMPPADKPLIALLDALI